MHLWTLLVLTMGSDPILIALLSIPLWVNNRSLLQVNEQGEIHHSPKPPYEFGLAKLTIISSTTG